MSSSTADFPSLLPSLASSLPFEILDLIFSFYFRTRTITDQVTGKHLSLVCRTWCGPAQRYLLASIVVTQTSEFESITNAIQEKEDLGPLIRSLRIKIEAKESDWTIKELNNLLAVLPRLTSFDLTLGKNSPGFDVRYSDLSELPNLKELHLNSFKYDPELVSYRDIISKTPNITSLTLSNESSQKMSAPKRKTLRSATLPALKRLSLQSAQFCRLFDKSRLLDSKTLNQITELEINPEGASVYNAKYSTLNLFKLIGSNIIKLTLGPEEENICPDENILQHCSNVQSLTAKRSFGMEHVPKSLKTVTYARPSHWFGIDECAWMTWAHFWGNGFTRNQLISAKSEWVSVESFEFINATPTDEVKKMLANLGIEVIVDGEVYDCETSSTGSQP